MFRGFRATDLNIWQRAMEEQVVEKDHRGRSGDKSLGRWGDYFSFGTKQRPDGDMHPLATQYRQNGGFRKAALEVGLPVEGLYQTLTGILMRIVAEGRLLTVPEFYDPFDGCFRGVIVLVVGIGIVIGIVPGEGAAYTQVQDLQGDEAEQQLTHYK